jgi:hypothetical protein
MPMKNLFLPVFALLLVTFASCRKDSIYDGLPIVSESRNLKNFDGIEVQGAIEVRLIDASSYRVNVETYSDLQPQVETFISNGVLVVRMANGYDREGQEVVVKVQAPDIYEVKLVGSGLVRTDNHHNFGDYLEVALSGSGYIDLRGDARTTKVNLSGSGNIDLWGSGRYFEAISSGSGDIDAFDFTVDEADVRLSGSGNMRLDVWRFLQGDLLGSGDIIFEGNPRIDIFRTGSGIMRRR